MEYGSDHAELYDVVFRSRGRDYQAEAAEVTRLVRSRLPGARTLLDVACGTGAHLAAFAGSFDEVEGLEYSPGMRDIAMRKVPGSPIHLDDMRAFDLGRSFDAVACLCNAVAEVDDAADLTAAVARMAAHLVPGGVLVIEPWYFPENFINGYVGGHMVKEPGRVISRMTHSTRQGSKVRLEFRFVVAEPSGFKDFSEVLMINLFSRRQYEEAFERAGLTCELIPSFIMADGRTNSPGLFVGVRKE